MSTVFEAELEVSTPAVSALAERMSGFLEAGGVDPRTTHHVVLVFDEILTNVAQHGHGSRTTAAVRIAIAPDAVDGEISDTGVPFDPRDSASPDVEAGVDDRPVGGLGLFLIRRLTSSYDYVRRDGRNCTRFSIPRMPAQGKGAS